MNCSSLHIRSITKPNLQTLSDYRQSGKATLLWILVDPTAFRNCSPSSDPCGLHVCYPERLLVQQLLTWSRLQLLHVCCSMQQCQKAPSWNAWSPSEPQQTLDRVLA